MTLCPEVGNSINYPSCNMRRLYLVLSQGISSWVSFSFIHTMTVLHSSLYKPFVREERVSAFEWDPFVSQTVRVASSIESVSQMVLGFHFFLRHLLRVVYCEVWKYSYLTANDIFSVHTLCKLTIWPYEDDWWTSISKRFNAFKTVLADIREGITSRYFCSLH